MLHDCMIQDDASFLIQLGSRNLNLVLSFVHPDIVYNSTGYLLTDAYTANRINSNVQFTNNVQTVAQDEGLVIYKQAEVLI